MDFLKKKAFEAQLNKVGKDLGLGSNVTSGFSGSSRQEPRNSAWNVFSTQENGDTRDENNENEFAISPALLTYYESMPYNFPPYLRMFYINRSILSDAANPPVTTAYNFLCAMASLLLLNSLLAVLFTSLEKGKDWPFLLMSAGLTVLLTLYELYAFEVAFRGAYQTSTGLRKWYIALTSINLVLVSLYAFVGVGFFNGWTRLASLNKTDDSEEQIEHEGARRIATIIESILWSALLVFNIHVLFNYYHLVYGRDQGLSPEAIVAANRALANEDVGGDNEAGMRDGEGNRDGGVHGRKSRIQEIRDRYRADQV
eukprot:GFKZ01007455.1.p1 GENE.GFKZ01007455.1~~GFKZ01007455.1.p1  ORF type:complete len:313 (-),score=39.27 GFKZ01007455.1:1015-1953(-)